MERFCGAGNSRLETAGRRGEVVGNCRLGRPDNARYCCLVSPVPGCRIALQTMEPRLPRQGENGRGFTLSAGMTITATRLPGYQCLAFVVEFCLQQFLALPRCAGCRVACLCLCAVIPVNFGVIW